MENELPIKIGSCYKISDGLTIELPKGKYLHTLGGCIVLVLDIHLPYEKKKSDMPHTHLYGLKLLTGGKIGWWTFSPVSHSHTLILENKLLEDIENLENNQ